MKIKPTSVLAVFFLLGIAASALSGCGGGGTFRDQDGYIQNAPASPSVVPSPVADPS